MVSILPQWISHRVTSVFISITGKRTSMTPACMQYVMTAIRSKKSPQFMRAASTVQSAVPTITPIATIAGNGKEDVATPLQSVTMGREITNSSGGATSAYQITP